MAFEYTPTPTPNFDIMGLLLGGRGYASGWFQNRDRLKQIDIAQQKELADRQRYTQGVLGGPELQKSIDNPYDRRTQWNLWGQMATGPESMVPLANSLLTGSMGAIESRDQATLSSQLSAANIKLSADEQLRVDQIQNQRKLDQQKSMLTYLFTPQSDGGTPAQQQMQRDFVAQSLGIPSQPGYSIAEGGNGYEPTIGGTVWKDMMNEGQSVSNLINSAQYLQTMAQTGLGDKDKWSAVRADMLLNIKKAEALGTLDQGTSDFFAQVVPEYYGGGVGDSTWGPDVSDKLADTLKTNIKLWNNKLAQIGDKYRVPTDVMKARQSFGNEPVDDKALTKRFPVIDNPSTSPTTGKGSNSTSIDQSQEQRLRRGSGGVGRR